MKLTWLPLFLMFWMEEGVTRLVPSSAPSPGAELSGRRFNRIGLVSASLSPGLAASWCLLDSAGITVARLAFTRPCLEGGTEPAPAPALAPARLL